MQLNGLPLMRNKIDTVGANNVTITSKLRTFVVLAQ